MTKPEASIKLGKLIREVRIEKGISEYELAEAIDESIYYLHQIEQGMIDPMMNEVFNIIKSLGSNPREFFEDFEKLIAN